MIIMRACKVVNLRRPIHESIDCCKTKHELDGASRGNSPVISGDLSLILLVGRTWEQEQCTTVYMQQLQSALLAYRVLENITSCQEFEFCDIASNCN